MAEMSREELLRAEAIGSEQGWVAPLTQEDKEYLPICGQCSSGIALFRLRRLGWSTILWYEYS